MFRSNLLMIWPTGMFRQLPVWCLIVLSLLSSAQLAAAKKSADGSAGAGKPVGIVTILQGSASVIHDLSEFDAVEGMRLFPDDLVRTDRDAFVRVEYEDKTWVELGPETVLQISHPATRRGKSPGLYLMEGWLKLGCNEGTRQTVASIGMDLTDLSGVLVLRMGKGSREVFAEQGTARWVNRSGRTEDSINLNKGDFLVAAPGSPPAVKSRPTPEFVAALPRPYRDSLPVRYAQFANRPVAGRAERPFSYAEVQIWLNAEPQVRKQFVVLWRRKLQDPAFRAALDSEMPLHHEWDPILHPEKYLPPQPPVVPPQSPAPVAPAANAPQMSSPQFK